MLKLLAGATLFLLCDSLHHSSSLLSQLEHQASAASSGVARIKIPEDREEPSRHIQYWWNSHAGIGDRIAILNRLLWLGWKYNATIHMSGGDSAHESLSVGHSRVFHKSWSRYLDFPGSCGRTPFNPIHAMHGCVAVSDTETDFQKLFRHGETCLHITKSLYRFKKLKPTPSDLLASGCNAATSFSPAVKSAAADFLKSYEVNGSFATLHIRRCDRVRQTGTCTSPNNVLELLKEQGAATGVNTWLIFTYAGKGYTQALKAALAPLNSTLRILLEDEVRLNALEPRDNYLTFQIARRLSQLANFSLGSRACAHAVQRLGLLQGARAVCE